MCSVGGFVGANGVAGRETGASSAQPTSFVSFFFFAFLFLFFLFFLENRYDARSLVRSFSARMENIFCRICNLSLIIIVIYQIYMYMLRNINYVLLFGHFISMFILIVENIYLCSSFVVVFVVFVPFFNLVKNRPHTAFFLNQSKSAC